MASQWIGVLIEFRRRSARLEFAGLGGGCSSISITLHSASIISGDAEEEVDRAQEGERLTEGMRIGLKVVRPCRIQRSGEEGDGDKVFTITIIFFADVVERQWLASCGMRHDSDDVCQQELEGGRSNKFHHCI